MTAVPHIRGPVQRFLSFLLIALLSAPMPAMAGGDDKYVTVTMGEPTAWSLEQAHYLLERMHAVNHSLNSKTPDQDALDPNATNGSRLEVLRTVLSAAAQFNAPLAAETEAKLDSFQLDLNRRRNLQARLDQFRARHQEVAVQLATLRAEQAQLQASPATAPQAAQLNPQITALDGERMALETQMTSLTTELNTAVTVPELDEPDVTLGGNSGVAPEVAGSMITQALEGTGAGLNNPRLHVSTVLDNHIQMQYEIIAKQLSLLRDEVGPDQRVIFLELPVSIYSVPKKADKKLVQVKWKISDVCLQSALEGRNVSEDEDSKDYQNSQHEDQEDVDFWESEGDENSKPYTYHEIVQACEGDELWTPVRAMSSSQAAMKARVVDLIPRQSALNVNQIYNTSRVGAFGLQALWSGFGAAAQFQRQRELFEQFIHQDMFASGFGKGETEFGWTFGALPGTKRIAPGVRSTFAVVVVPREALAVKLQYDHGVYRMKEMPVSNFQNSSFVTVPLPPMDEGFYVDRITYTPVEPGKKVSVFLTGTGFSPQMGVLVNGVPLRRAISLGRPKLVSADVAAAFDGAPADGIDGEYELVNSQRIALQFSAGANYEGTPSIMLVTSQKASLINHYPLSINGLRGRNSLIYMSKRSPMFLPKLEVQDVQLSSCTGSPAECKVAIIGKGFRYGAIIRINGEFVKSLKQYSTTLYTGKVAMPETAELDIVMRQTTRQKLEEVSSLIPNRRVFRTAGYEVLGFEGNGTKKDAFVHVKVGLLGTDPRQVRAQQLGIPGSKTFTPTPLASGDLVAKLENVGNSLLLQLTRTDNQTEVVPIVIPSPPEVRAIVGPSGKNQGPAGGGYLVTFQGKHLQDVKRVFFGTKAATVYRATPSELLVTAPGGDAGQVPIVLETDVKFLGRFLDNTGDPLDKRRFIYEAPPPPKS